MTRTERGSATILVLFVAVLLFTAIAAAILWSAIATARHKLASAADLTALSAAQTLTTAGALRTAAPGAPCPTAARTAALNEVQLTACRVSADAVTVEVSLQVDLRLTRATLTAAARAGPA